jgi:hypothetical protein
MILDIYLDGDVVENDGVAHTDARANDGVGANADAWTNLCGRINLGRWMDKDIADNFCAITVRLGQQIRRALTIVMQVQLVCQQRRSKNKSDYNYLIPGSLELAPK